MNLIVETSDKHRIPVTEEVVNFSNIWKMMINDDFDDVDFDETECREIVIPTPIRKELLDFVFYFIEQSIREPVGEITKPLPNVESFGDVDGIPTWAEGWLKSLTKLELQSIIMCANFLDIQSLLHLCSSYVAYGIKGKTLDEIKKEWSGHSVNPKLD